MNPWIPSTRLASEIELLVRRWQLPIARAGDVAQLLAAQAEGGTACPLPDDAPADAAAWGSACRAVSAPADFPAAPIPLVLRRHAGRWHLQSWRFFRAETEIARELLARAAQAAPALPRDPVELLADLGPGQVNDAQARAIACALRHTLALVTGGPGTGKTHTLARLLALLVAADPRSEPVIHLAAPTGKAADRMREAVEAAADHLPASLPAGTRERLKAAAAGAGTLHRLLGLNPVTGRCRALEGGKLRADVVIVDEASMVDTLLWHALLAALPASTRLVLLGDPHQLESVAAGDVLGALVRLAGAAPANPLAPIWTELTQSQRFQDRPGIGALAAAIVNRQADAAVSLLEEHRISGGDAEPAGGLAWLGAPAGALAWDSLPPAVQAAIAAVADATAPAEALAALGRVRLLTAHREHALGAAGLNAAIHDHLLRRPHVRRTPNQPVIINHNDPETGLINGSVGIVMETAGGRSAFFPAASATAAPRALPVSRLPDHSPAWALTIHRSQGSEFDQVVVVLPAAASPLATRELLYTAVTRARRGVYVWGGEASVRAALGDRAQRCTLLEASFILANSVGPQEAQEAQKNCRSPAG